jgi:uncharacterized protein
MPGVRRISVGQARRMALAAQGFADPRPSGRVDIRHLRRVLRRTGLLQIDSVNVVQRAHYLPLFSRLGPYDPDLLDDAAYRRRELFEYWVHEASLVPTDLHPFLRHRMAARRAGRRARALMESEPGYIEAVLAEVGERGPLRPSQLRDPGTATGPWWGWSKGKTALEHLFARGQVAVADRHRFVRAYDLTERVLPAGVLATPTPDPVEADRELVRRAARHLGVATVDDLADYHRLPVARVRAVLDALVTAGDLQPVEVAGWQGPTYADPGAVVPRRVQVQTVLSPFDPLVFHRPRAERLFDFHYRIEIYVPAEARRYGYYVLPLLVDDRIVGRADCKADRRLGRLMVWGAWWEEPGDDHLAPRVATALRDLADWLGLDDVQVAEHGSAAPALRRAPALRARADGRAVG